MVFTYFPTRIFSFVTLILFLVGGCGGANHVVKYYYSDYDCQQLFESMEYKIGEANILYTNYEDENQVSKFGRGGVQTAAGVGMASALLLTPLGWLIAGGLVLGGGKDMIDSLGKDELSQSEKLQLAQYEREYEDIKKVAVDKECDYLSIPKWDVSPENAR